MSPDVEDPERLLECLRSGAALSNGADVANVMARFCRLVNQEVNRAATAGYQGSRASVFATLPSRNIDVFLLICRCLTMGDRVVVTTVCRLWRSVALSCATLWSDFTVERTDAAGTRGAQELLERSRGAPVRMAVKICDHNIGTLSSLITLHLSHFERLSLHVWPSSLGNQNWLLVKSALVGDACVMTHLCVNAERKERQHHGRLPTLEQLQLEQQREQQQHLLEREDQLLQRNLIAGSTWPMLRFVTLQGVPGRMCTFRVSPTVQTLVYVHPEHLHMTRIDLERLLCAFPRLSSLSISACSYHDGDEHTSHALPLATTLDEFQCAMGRGYATALRWTNLAEVALVSLTSHWKQRANDEVLPPHDAQQRIDEIGVTMNSVTIVQYDRLGTTRRERRRSCWRIGDGVTVLDHGLLSSLSVLTLHEFLWPRTGMLPDAPKLVKLDVLLGAREDYTLYHNWLPLDDDGLGWDGQGGQALISLFSLRHVRAHPCRLGALRELVLRRNDEGSCPDDRASTITVAASDLLPFVHMVADKASPLASIKLVGVRLLEAAHEVAEFERLLQYCHDFESEGQY